jgi:hypothetical protein
MAVDKNFIVRNGLEVGGSLIWAQAGSGKVGINTTQFEGTNIFQVAGGIGATNLTVSQSSTFYNAEVTNGLILDSAVISIAGTAGKVNQYIRSTGNGLAWADLPISQKFSSNFTANPGQVTFSATYVVGLVDVFINGVRLTDSEYVAVDGATVSLLNPCFGGENVDIVGQATIGLGSTDAIQGITVLEEGVAVGAAQNITSINFVGAAVTAVGLGVGVTVYIDTPLGGGDSYWDPISTTGIHTSRNVAIGTQSLSGSEILRVQGDARVTGILTVGEASITFNGQNNTIGIGTGTVISESGITVGVITAVSFTGSLSGAASSVTVTNSVSTTTTYYPTFASSDGQILVDQSKLLYQPSSGELKAGSVNVSGLTSTRTLRVFSGISGGLTITGITTINSGRLQFGTGLENVRIGYNAAQNVTGNSNIAIGDQPLAGLTSGSTNIAIGQYSLDALTSGSNNIAIGERAGRFLTGNYNVILGKFDGNSNNLDIRTSSNNIVIADGQGNIRQYVTSSGRVGFNTVNPVADFHVIGNSRFSGIVTAAYFVGDGSGLTNISGVGVGAGVSVTISDSPPVSPSPGNLWYSSLIGRGFIYYDDGDSTQWVDFSPVGVSGTITSGSGVGDSYWRTAGVGIHTLSNVGIGTTNATSVLTVKGNTSLETLTVSGVSTLNSLSIGKVTNLTNLSSGDNPFNANNIINVGGDMAIFHLNDGTFGTSNRILLNENDLIIGTKGESGGNIYYSDLITVSVGNDLGLPNTSSVALGYGDGGGYKLQTIGAGVTVTGTTFTNQLSVSGVVTATTFVGNFSGSITDATNLTGGYANASQLNVSGVATISQGRIQADASANLRFGNLPAGSGSGRNIAIGDQVLVSLSGGSGRNIGIGELSYYDTTTGQYNIGVGERAGQKVSTGSYNVILGAYDGNSGNLDIRTSSRNVVIADGEGNIRQYINSSGNVGIKTTVVTEALTVAGVVSATSFYGTLNAGQLTGSLPAIDGSALIGVVGSGSGVIIEDDATPVGTAGTINFGSNLSVSFASGIATVSGASSVSEATTAYGLAGTPNIYVGITTVDYLRAGSYSDINNAIIIASDPAGSVSGNINVSSKELQIAANGFTNGDRGNIVFYRKESFLNKSEIATLYSDTGNLSIDGSLTSGGNSDSSFNGNVKVGTAITLSNSGHINATGVITATSFYGSGANLTSLPAGQLTGTLPAIDGSALLNVTASGTGVVVEDDQVNVGSATTIDFGTGLDVTFSAGIATITASGGSLQSRTTVTGVTTSIANNGIGNTNITGFKSYALMKVGLSTAGWLRLYTDSASRAADASRSVGIDPTPGSGVIAEVVTTGISTTQIISPFVMGGNLDNPADTTIYAAITNLSGSTQAITANLTILQLEA